MDLKPSIVVIDIHGNALLIDISGVGGITYEWAAPEMRDKKLLNLSQREKAQSDIWAYGKIMFALAQSRDWGDEVAFLREAVMETTLDDPEMRIGLLDVISILQESGERWIYIIFGLYRRKGKTPPFWSHRFLAPLGANDAVRGKALAA